MSEPTQSSSSAPAKGHGNLTLWIVGGIVLAVIVALIAPVFASKLKLGGDIFLNLLKMIVVPLVVTSVMSGILGLGDVRKLGRPGVAAVTYYLVTTLLAVIVGILVVNAIQPGAGIDGKAEVAKLAAEKPMHGPSDPNGPKTIGELLQSLTMLLFTDNLLKSAAE
ncbi:MAG: cation:dicarboxylase symporter family transporter, partial [Verrucomicrobiae bacterium]|nr:cation:dicarboxylase symporter family transporter [Verrucomicrobiae bacterium]